MSFEHFTVCEAVLPFLLGVSFFVFFFVTYLSIVLLSPFSPLAEWFLLCDLKEHGTL